MINVQTDPSTTDSKETIVERVAQSSSSEPKDLDTSSESSNSIDLIPWLILFIVAFFVFGGIKALMNKKSNYGSGGNTGGSGVYPYGSGGEGIGGDGD